MLSSRKVNNMHSFCNHLCFNTLCMKLEQNKKLELIQVTVLSHFALLLFHKSICALKNALYTAANAIEYIQIVFFCFMKVPFNSLQLVRCVR